jgi:acid phosphatase (class A)
MTPLSGQPRRGRCSGTAGGLPDAAGTAADLTRCGRPTALGLPNGYPSASSCPTACLAAAAAGRRSAQQADPTPTAHRARHAAPAPAAKDANLHFPAAASTFECALRLPISQQATPHLNMLLRRTLVDAGLATYAAKDNHQRQRPFAAAGGASCTPAEEAALAKDGSYPSGHAAIGWAWALVLTQAAPQHTDALLQRGVAFGQSRVICGVHWQSDVEAGRSIGAATAARLQSDATFNAQLALARDEIASAQAQAAKPSADCAAEAAAPALR